MMTVTRDPCPHADCPLCKVAAAEDRERRLQETLHFVRESLEAKPYQPLRRAGLPTVRAILNVVAKALR